MEVLSIPLDRIDVPEGHRAADAKSVQSLRDSILDLGLLQPIGVKKVGRRYELVYGRHRLEAMQQTASKTIAAAVLDGDAIHVEMATLDENLRRRSLSAIEEAQALKRRKELYEALHPETRAHVAGGKARGRREGDAPPVESFTADASKATGRSRRTIERSVSVAERLTPEAAEIVGKTPALADNAAEQDRLARLPADEQRVVAQCIHDGDAASVAECLKTHDEPEGAAPAKPKKLEPGERLARRVRSVVLAWLDEDSEAEPHLPAVAAARLESLAEEVRGKAK